MATNQYKNKVVYGGDTLIDLTEDTVTASTLMAGVTAHLANGAPVTGTYTPVNIYIRRWIRNYFKVIEGTYGGVEITLEDNGVICLNGGPTTAATYIPVENTLSAGTYTAKQTTISGTQTAAGHPNLRYGSTDVGSASTRWVNGVSSNTESTQTFEGDTYLFLNFGTGQTFDNFRVKYEIYETAAEEEEE